MTARQDTIFKVFMSLMDASTELNNMDGGKDFSEAVEYIKKAMAAMHETVKKTGE